MAERKELSVDVIVRPRGENATVYSHATGLDPREIADWLDRAIIALGREREALGHCGIHGEPDLWEDRADRDEVELAAKLHEMRRTSKGWRKDAVRQAIDCIHGDVEARRIIRDAAALIRDPADLSAKGSEPSCDEGNRATDEIVLPPTPETEGVSSVARAEVAASTGVKSDRHEGH